MVTVQDLIDTKNSLEYNVDEIARKIRQFKFVQEVQVRAKRNKTGNLCVYFNVITNVEFISDDQDDDILYLMIDGCLETRKRTGLMLYFKHRFVGVIKFFFFDDEYDTWIEAYKAATSYLRKYRFVHPIDKQPEDLIEFREI